MDPSSPSPVTSPCIGVCTLDQRQVCVGCLRTLAEIAAWTRLSDRERRHLLHTVLPQREAARGSA